MIVLLYEPCFEKPAFSNMVSKNNGADQLRSNRTAEQCL